LRPDLTTDYTDTCLGGTKFSKRKQIINHNLSIINSNGRAFGRGSRKLLDVKTIVVENIALKSDWRINRRKNPDYSSNRREKKAGC